MRRAPGNIVATLALVGAISGGAFAAGGLPGKNSVRSNDIANGEVKAKDLGRNAIAARAFRADSVPDGDVRVLDSATAALDDEVPDDFFSTDGAPILGRPGLEIFPRCTREGANVTASLSASTDPGVSYRYGSLQANGAGAGSGSGGGSFGLSAFSSDVKASDSFEFALVTDQPLAPSNRVAGQAMLTVHGDEAECEVVVNIYG